MSSPTYVNPFSKPTKRQGTPEENAIAQTAIRAWEARHNTPDFVAKCCISSIVLDILDCVCESMETNNITEQQLAERTGVPSSLVQQILSGEHDAVLLNLGKLQSALGESLILTPLTAIHDERVIKGMKSVHLGT